MMEDALKKAGIWGVDQQLAFPIITKAGVNQQGKMIHYYFNYSNEKNKIVYPHANAHELISGMAVSKNTQLELQPWGVMIIAEN